LVLLNKKKPWCPDGLTVPKLTASTVANNWNKVKHLWEDTRHLPVIDEYELETSGLGGNNVITAFMKPTQK
jgi:hypothetical protein